MHKHKPQKEVAFLWLVNHKVVAMKERCGQISIKIDKSCLRCGPQFVESMEDRFLTFPLAQQVWHYETNIDWQLLPKEVTLTLGKMPFSSTA